jgi:hypothetical protein
MDVLYGLSFGKYFDTLLKGLHLHIFDEVLALHESHLAILRNRNLHELLQFILRLYLGNLIKAGFEVCYFYADASCLASALVD